ncbi:hypothetical protein [Roseivirga pacifica]|uniref:hypothetical protein n=1 Tax=Roseivirga pacifica TaxID=1267423 RepID=UPI00209465D2|nr:hypothetical protein [Roseivirga pacifica]MCO6359444.1 hypothetical protein [Roseivirga pacifica]MCO6366814.1 hypothetical protein [Roseivirga pacifica]MCO6370654.1 hypothetical protein [Roseivirga pacifica]MCO6374470.1 hypothetical protein [Roseivirga pacifica]MCO6379729.1 hypothetical protein [Roseivirga pacifica]
MEIKLTLGRVLSGLFVPALMLTLYFYMEYILKLEHAYDIFLIILTVNFVPTVSLVISYIINDFTVRVHYDESSINIKSGDEELSYLLSEVEKVEVVYSYLYRFLGDKHGYMRIIFNDNREFRISNLLSRSINLKGVAQSEIWVAYPML